MKNLLSKIALIALALMGTVPYASAGRIEEAYKTFKNTINKIDGRAAFGWGSVAYLAGLGVFTFRNAYFPQPLATEAAAKQAYLLAETTILSNALPLSLIPISLGIEDAAEDYAHRVFQENKEVNETPTPAPAELSPEEQQARDAAHKEWEKQYEEHKKECDKKEKIAGSYLMATGLYLANLSAQSSLTAKIGGLVLTAPIAGSILCSFAKNVAMSYDHYKYYRDKYVLRKTDSAKN